jgi:hypothetical protein
MTTLIFLPHLVTRYIVTNDSHFCIWTIVIIQICRHVASSYNGYADDERYRPSSNDLKDDSGDTVDFVRILIIFPLER